MAFQEIRNNHEDQSIPKVNGYFRHLPKHTTLMKRTVLQSLHAGKHLYKSMHAHTHTSMHTSKRNSNLMEMS